MTSTVAAKEQAPLTAAPPLPDEVLHHIFAFCPEVAPFPIKLCLAKQQIVKWQNVAGSIILGVLGVDGWNDWICEGLNDMLWYGQDLPTLGWKTQGFHQYVLRGDGVHTLLELVEGSMVELLRMGAMVSKQNLPTGAVEKFKLCNLECADRIRNGGNRKHCPVLLNFAVFETVTTPAGLTARKRIPTRQQWKTIAYRLKFKAGIAWMEAEELVSFSIWYTLNYMMAMLLMEATDVSKKMDANIRYSEKPLNDGQSMREEPPNPFPLFNGLSDAEIVAGLGNDNAQMRRHTGYRHYVVPGMLEKAAAKHNFPIQVSPGRNWLTTAIAGEHGEKTFHQQLYSGPGSEKGFG